MSILFRINGGGTFAWFRKAQQWNVTDSSLWGSPVLVNGVLDWTLPFRNCIAAASSFGIANSSVQEVTVPAGTYGLSPQVGDNNPIWRRCITPSSFVRLQGAGAGSTVLRFYCQGMTNPVSNWVNTGDGYVKISRGSLFMNDSSAVISFSIDGMTLDGQAGYTGDFTVGGNTTTGDGWDMTHKGIGVTNANSDFVKISNCILANWRGEIVYSGGMKNLYLDNCTIKGSNASAISVSAKLLMRNCTVGGPIATDYVYNGLENFALGSYQNVSPHHQVVEDCVFQIRTAGNGYGIVFIGMLDTSFALRRCIFSDCNCPLLLGQAGANITVEQCSWSNVSNGVVTTGASGQNTGTDRGWSNVVIRNCTQSLESSSGALFLAQGAPTYKVHDGLTLEANTINSGTLFAGSFLGDWVNWTCPNNSFASGSKLVGTTSGTARPLWTGTTYGGGTATSYVGSVDKHDIFTGATSIAASCFGSRIWANSKIAANASLTLDDSTNMFPIGAEFEVYAGATGWSFVTTGLNESLPNGGFKKFRKTVNGFFELVA